MTYYESESFYNSSLHHIFESENFRFPFPTDNSLNWGMKCEKRNFVTENRKEFITLASKIVHEWKGQPEFFSRLQVTELKFEAISASPDNLQKTVAGCPRYIRL